MTTKDPTNYKALPKSMKAVKFLDAYTKLRKPNHSQTEKERAVRKAMLEAGYKGVKKDPRAIIRQGLAMLQGYDKLAADPEKILDSVGFTGELTAQLLKDVATQTKSRTAQVQALNITTKCRGWQRETLDLETGVPIVIEGGKSKVKPKQETEKPVKRKAVVLRITK